MAFIRFFLIIAGGIVLVAIGKDGAGLATSLGGLAASIGLFISRKRRATKELKEKNPE